MTIKCDVSVLESQCGGRLLHNFNFWGDYSLKKIKTMYPGIMLIATFNQTQEKEYLECCKTFKLLGQSTPIVNPNSGNKIFTVIFKA